MNPHPLDNFCLVCVLCDFTIENASAAAWCQCKGDNFHLTCTQRMPSPRHIPTTESPTKLRGWLLHWKVPSSFVMKRRLWWCFVTPKDQQEEFDCSVLCQFVHVMEEGDESAFFNGLTGSGGNIADTVQVTEIVTNNTSESTEMEDSDNTVLTEIEKCLESCMASGAPAINNEDARLIHSLFLGMVEDDYQPLPKNISTMAEQQESNPPEFFRGWEHCGSCYQCLNGGRKNKVHVNYNHEVSRQSNNCFRCFSKDFIVGMIVPVTCRCLQVDKQCSMTYGSSCAGWLYGS